MIKMRGTRRVVMNRRVFVSVARFSACDDMSVSVEGPMSGLRTMFGHAVAWGNLIFSVLSSELISRQVELPVACVGCSTIEALSSGISPHGDRVLHRGRNPDPSSVDAIDQESRDAKLPIDAQVRLAAQGNL
jgi:hypothetical protein